jgi:DNA-binding winged helix-turn-helix (wHTH) protein
VKTQRLYEFGPFRLDADEGMLLRGSARVDLTPKALGLLALLLENQGRLVTKEEIKQRVWPGMLVVEDSNLTFNITVIRRALGDHRNNGNRFIETVPTRGYRFIAPVTQIGPPVSNLATGDRPAIPLADAGVVPVPDSNGAAIENAGASLARALGTNAEAIRGGRPRGAYRPPPYNPNLVQSAPWSLGGCGGR